MTKRQRKRLYMIYHMMRQRCYNKNHVAYKYYGGNGIKVCALWMNKNGFNNFLKDMGPPPSKKHSLDRYPNKKGNYIASNCRWATKFQQGNNTSANIIIKYNGIKKPLGLWAKELKLNKDRCWSRYNAGYTPKEIFEATKFWKQLYKRGKRHHGSLKLKGRNTDTGQTKIFYGIPEAAKYVGASIASVRQSIKVGCRVRRWRFKSDHK